MIPRDAKTLLTRVGSIRYASGTREKERPDEGPAVGHERA